MMEPVVQVKSHPPSGTIILNRPDKRNALSRILLMNLKQAFEDLHQERKVRAVILTGAGAAFCSGLDLQEMQATAQESQAHAQWYDDANQYKDLIETMLRFPKPIIAAVNGPAVAGGAGLLLASDIVLASHEATFGLPEPRRGLVAGLVAPLLVYRLGAGQAANLLLTARTVDAAEAHARGIFHELVSSHTLWARGHELAGQCAQSAAEALQLTKRMLNEMIGENLPTLLSSGAAVSATARTTEAAAEGLSAFLDKREPRWP